MRNCVSVQVPNMQVHKYLLKCVSAQLLVLASTCACAQVGECPSTQVSKCTSTCAGACASTCAIAYVRKVPNTQVLEQVR